MNRIISFNLAVRNIMIAVMVVICLVFSTQKAECVESVSQAFKMGRSNQDKYAYDKDEFYVALKVESSTPSSVVATDDCIDHSFLSWLRRLVNRNSIGITLVADVKGPSDSNSRKIPLFEVSKNENVSPQTCVTDIIHSRTITQYYKADKINNFRIDAELKTVRDDYTNAASTILATANELLQFTGGSASLTSKIAGSAVERAAKKIDDSISQSNGETNQIKYHFDISPWPSMDNDTYEWDNHLDRGEFSIVNLVASPGGIRVDKGSYFSVAISPTYQISLFGDGEGKYMSSAEILAQRLVSQDGDNLNQILLTKMPGFNTDGATAISITDSAQMDKFCRDMKTVFAGMFTKSDELALRYAVLDQKTNYLRIDKLQEAKSCLSVSEKKRLPELNPDFVVYDLKTAETNRNSFVHNRIKMLAKPLVGNSKDDLLTVIGDLSNFTIDVSKEAISAFPQRLDGKSWGNVSGEAAIDQLIEAGGFRLGCGQAVKEISLKNIIAVVLNNKTGKNAALFIEYSNSDPNFDANPSEEKPIIKRLSFYSIGELKRLFDLSYWPDDNCYLAY